MIKNDSEKLNFNLYSWGLIVCALVFQILRWGIFPMFIDIYYHLSVMLGFSEAGGYTASSFWEYAPVGRPHLYPPFLHILMLIIHKMGLSELLVAKLVSFSIYPFTLIAIWLFARSLFNSRTAFFSVLLASSSFYFYLETSNIIGFSLALSLGLIGLVFLLRERPVSACIFMALVFYTHIIVGWVVFLAVLFYAIISNKIGKYAKVLIASFLLYLPLFVHQINNLKFLRFVDVKAKHYIEFNVVIYLVFLLSVYLLSRRKIKANKLLLSLTASLVLLSFNFPQRIFSGSGLVVFIFWAAMALDWIAGLGRIKQIFLIIVSFVLFFLCSPTVYLNWPKEIRFKPVNSAFINFLPELKASLQGNEVNIYTPQFIDPIVKIIKGNSQKQDIIYSNFNYSAGMFSVLSQRPTSTAMLQEVAPYKDFDKIASSSLIIWLKELNGEPSSSLKEAIYKYGLKRVAETEIVYVYRNESCRAKAKIVRANVPFGLILLVLSLLFGGLLYDNLLAKRSA